MIDKYKLSKETLHYIVTESQQRFPDETGGILVGRVDNGCAFIHCAIGPGENACHTSNGFMRDGDYSQEQLDFIVNETAGRYDYLGEWHSHFFDPKPSPVDINSMHWIADNADYLISHPILLLCVFTERYHWETVCFAMTEKRLTKLKERSDESFYHNLR